jgi:hypothetical protein
MNQQSFKDNILARSRQLFRKLWTPEENNIKSSENMAVLFLQRYHCSLFPQQTLLNEAPNPDIFTLQVRTAELTLKPIHIYYLPYRLESLLHYCNALTAVATFLNALNFSYETLLKEIKQQHICQGIFQTFMTIDQSYQLDATTINEFPLYEAAATHDLEHFQATAFAFQRALDIIDILEQVQPRNYRKQQEKLLQFWHQTDIKDLEQTIQKLIS